MWDLHIHTPASYQWEGEKYGSDEARNAALVDSMIAALNDSEPAAFAIMDYWTFEGWFRLKQHTKSGGSAKLHKTVFPGIELRLSAPMKPRLNAHAIFTNEIADQTLRDFIAQLRLEITGRPLSNDALIEYARQVSDDKLRVHGLDAVRVQSDEGYALLAGQTVAELTVASYKEALRAVPDGQALGFLPFSTYGGLTEIDRNQHYAYAVSLFHGSPIFETRDFDSWAAFAGLETESNKKYLRAFQQALGNRPRLAVAGSDAHKFTSSDKSPDSRGYGDFPSNQKTWIKADPTWNGLQLTLKEPAKRSFLGPIPPKLSHVRQNRTFYIESIKIRKNSDSNLTANWFDGCNIPLNSDLVAVIGNKGSGKSALADIIALLGQTKDKQYFSFLKPGRFLGKAGEPARQFSATLAWLAGDPISLALSEASPPESVELVRYIPQGRFEALCNDHVSGRTSAFEGELRTVVFSHVPVSDREGALNFDQLTETRERIFRTSLDEQRKNLRAINTSIVALEDELHPTVRQNLVEQQKLKEQQLREVLSQEPPAVAQPSDSLSPEQQQAAARIARIDESLATNSLERAQLEEQTRIATKQLRSISNIEGGLQALQVRIGALKDELAADLAVVGMSFDDIAHISLKREKLEEVSRKCNVELGRIQERLESLRGEDGKLAAESTGLRAQLNAPQLAYQDWVKRNEAWKEVVSGIRGSEVDPESLEGIKKRIAQIDAVPTELAKLKERRSELTAEIFASLDSQRRSRAELFAPVQNMIGSEAVIGQGYSLQFKAKLNGSAETVASNIFDLVKQVSGELRGEEEGLQAIKSRFERFEFLRSEDATLFAEDMVELLNASKPQASVAIPGLRSLMRKDRDPKQVYDYLYGLEYLEPQYSLLFQSTPIEQLSPGQRGALLLIFYLLVDKGRNPIILDQPEENLDNETVVSLLVPVLSIAKQRRQIIMVTHNPNLAIVCDAEQIVHAKFERNPEISVSYSAGSIENPEINRVIVDILEGTKVAFDNRGGKYQ